MLDQMGVLLVGLGRTNSAVRSYPAWSPYPIVTNFGIIRSLVPVPSALPETVRALTGQLPSG